MLLGRDLGAGQGLTEEASPMDGSKSTGGVANHQGVSVAGGVGQRNNRLCPETPASTKQTHLQIRPFIIDWNQKSRLGVTFLAVLHNMKNTELRPRFDASLRIPTILA